MITPDMSAEGAKYLLDKFVDDVCRSIPELGAALKVAVDKARDLSPPASMFDTRRFAGAGAPCIGDKMRGLILSLIQTECPFTIERLIREALIESTSP